MAYGNVDLAFLNQTSRIAKIKKNFIDSITDDSGAAEGTRIWSLVDNTGDEDYENYITGLNRTATDANLLNAKIGTLLNNWFYDHNSYFQTVLGYTSGTRGYVELNNMRVPQFFADCYEEIYGAKMASTLVFAQEEDVNNILATFSAPSGVYTESTSPALDSNKFYDTPMKLVVTTQIGGGNLVANVTLANSQGDSIVHTMTLNNSSAVGVDTGEIGITNISGVSLDTDGNYVFALDTSDMSAFTAGSYVQLRDMLDAGTRTIANLVEYVAIDSIDEENFTITILADDLVHITNIDSGYVTATPCYSEVTSIALHGTNAATSGAVKLVPASVFVPAL